MSKEIAVGLTGVGKMYKLYPSRLDDVLDTLGLTRFTPGKRGRYNEFWALRNINFRLDRGKSIGIIGRNGAGKSTLLKLITGNFTPTEGTIEVKGMVQALFDIGAGFHPEFTGIENLRASLSYQGLSPKEIPSAISEISEFTELGPFLKQPIKTYSTGMLARLGFAAVTTIKPDILIIDEVLGVGDAYFARKSNERMLKLIKGGSSVILVSHSMADIIRYCNEAIWIERGRIVSNGRSQDIVSEYQGFIRTLDERRLQAKNRKMQVGNKPYFMLDNYADSIVVSFTFRGENDTSFDLRGIALVKNGDVEDELKVGDVQDSNTSFSASLILDGSRWSVPVHDDRGYYRRLLIGNDSSGTAIGSAIFYSYGLFEGNNYSVRLMYHCQKGDELSVTLTKNGVVLVNNISIKIGDQDWITEEFLIISAKDCEDLGDITPATLNTAGKQSATETDQIEPIEVPKPWVRWRSDGSLMIDKVTIVNESGNEQAVFDVGQSLSILVNILAHRSGEFEFVPAASLYRSDGILVSQLIGQPMPVSFDYGEIKVFHLLIPAINLGNGTYMIALSIFEAKVSEDTRYDLVERSIEFKIIGNRSEVAEAVFQHDGMWSLY
jgi:lipopolysaccharide transport system ATP-binding protein